VVAIGAIAYLSHNKAPAGKDAAGTIVEAKRARADGTNSFNPTPTASTTDRTRPTHRRERSGADAAKDARGGRRFGRQVRRAQMDGGTGRQSAGISCRGSGCGGGPTGRFPSAVPERVKGGPERDEGWGPNAMKGSDQAGKDND